MRRSRFLQLAAAFAIVALVSPARADDELPSELAAQLVWKIASFDKNASARRQARPRVLVVQHDKDEPSARSATQLASYLAEVSPGTQVEIVTFQSAAGIVAAVRARAASMIVLTAGLENDAGDIANACAGQDVLSVGTTGLLVERGASVGIEIRSGKPKIVVNLPRARAQNVVFRAELLNLARIVL